MSKEKLSTPPKNYVNESSNVSTHSSPSYHVNMDNPSDQIDIDLQENPKSTSPILLYAPPLKAHHQLKQVKYPKLKWIPLPHTYM